jgi:hypothetical protein
MIIGTRWPHMIEALMIDNDLIERLKKAYQIKEDLNRIQSTGPEAKPNLGDLEMSKIERENYERIGQAKLDHLLSDRLTKQLFAASDLIKLLLDMTDTEIASLPDYLHIAKITSRGPDQLAIANTE